MNGRLRAIILTFRLMIPQQSETSFPTNWQIGAWTVRPSLNRIDGKGQSFKSTPKALATLLCLAQYQGKVVSRDVLFETVWAGSVVSDDTLNRAISDLRQIFGDTPQESQVIETIRRRGYRLIVPARPLESNPVRVFRAKKRGAFYFALAGLLLLFGVLGFSISRLQNNGLTNYRPVPLTSSSGFEFDVALSFDGESVAYTSSSLDDRQMDLFVKQIGEDNPTRLTNSERIEISPGWSPDGNALAFLAGEEAHSECGLYVIQLPSLDEQKMADCKSFLVSGVSWSPDGKTIAFSDRAGRDEPYQIYLLDLATRDVTPLSHPQSELFGDFSATFSPDGRSIAFIRGTFASTTALILTPALGDIHTIEVESGKESRLTHDNQEIPHIDWTPDGGHIVFASHRNKGMSGIWRIPAKGGEANWMFGENSYMRMPMLARSGNRLVFEQWDNEVSIWQVAIDSLSKISRTGRPLINSTHFDASPQFSPDGKHIAFTSQRSGASEIWISNSDGTQSTQLTSFDGPFTSNPQWSPDGAQLVFETRINGQTEVFAISVTGGKARQVTHDPLQDMVPSWSQDGRWIYFSSNRSGDWQTWKIAESGGEAMQVTRKGGFLARESPESAKGMLYYSRVDSAGLFRQAIAGGPAERLLPDLNADDWGNWVLTKKGIYYIQRFPTRLAFYDFATESITRQDSISFVPAGMISLSLSADGQNLAYVQQRFINADLWMINNFE